MFGFEHPRNRSGHRVGVSSRVRFTATWLSAIFVTVGLAPAFAQPPASDGADQEETQSYTPAYEPRPALEFRLWPDRFEMQPGNAFVRFQRASILIRDIRNGGEQPDAFANDPTDWLSVPLDEFPVDEVRQYLQPYRSALGEALAARNLRDSNYDLPIEQLRGVESIAFLLPEFQPMRELARFMALDIRLAIAEGRTEDALAMLSAGFRLADATGAAADFLIAKLVGLAIHGLMLAQVETLIATPDSPNLYWAMATLPPESTDITEALRFELTIIQRVFPALADLPKDDVSDDYWRMQLVQLVEDFQQIGPMSGSGMELGPQANARVLAGLVVVGMDAASRDQLMARGFDADQVAEMTPSEAVLRATAMRTREVEQSFLKLTYLPNSLRAERLAQLNVDAIPAGLENSIGDITGVLAQTLLPAVSAAYQASARSRQMIARMVSVEAIRDFVARNGEVPESLEDLQTLPAWNDPVTGEPFTYERLGAQRARFSWTPARQGVGPSAMLLDFSSASDDESSYQSPN